ncbi:MAG: DNA-3-methyladenine glycosylase 2 family protein [Gammaproteobacteria bacterium]|nr:DNA-3-methyladenine glycosylase 2 family protein [Gammaproteobacteria bacterium]
MELFGGLNGEALDRARVSRDPRFDGKFFVAVTSTGIYCRPICPSRLARRTNVRYFASTAAAESAGFRPCLRCRPEAAPGTPGWLGTAAVIRRALRLIEAGAFDDASVESLAARLGIGSRHLSRLFLRHVGASPLAVAHALRQSYRRAPSELRRAGGAVQRATQEVVLRLAYRPPYDWEQLRDFLAVRALPGIERVDARGYARTVACAGSHALICVAPTREAHALELRVAGAPPGALMQLAGAARRMFDLSADPQRIGRELAADGLVAPLLRSRPGTRIAGAWDPFECAVRAVLGQQVSVSAGRAFALRMVERLGVRIRDGAEGLTHLFPDAAAIAAAPLDSFGVTRSRAATLRALARAVLERRVDFDAAPEGVVAALLALPGIGPWTAQYVALRALGEPDSLPAGDLVLRRMAARAAPLLSARELEERAHPWRPWRGYAVMHLWRVAAA